MSSPEQNGAQNRKKRTREERKKLMVRIMALFLAFLMVAGAAYYTIYILTSAVGAADVAQTVQITNTSSLKSSGDVPVRVGLMVGENVTTGFEVTTTDGFIIGMTDEEAEPYTFTPLWELSIGTLAAVSDGNLSKTHMTYSLTWDTTKAVVGGYHVQVDCDKYNRDQVAAMIEQAAAALSGTGLMVVPAYVYTGYTLRIGSFTSRAEAEKWVGAVQSVFPNETVYATGASETSVSLVDPATDRILFEFDCGGREELAMQAQRDAAGNTYLKTPAANVYDGTFVFTRYRSATKDGVALTNILPLEAYIAGVVPYEVSNTWPIETLKAFAITVRSFTLTHLGRHEDSGFDLCSNAHCQMYKGAGRVNAGIYEAVTKTIGQVMTYKGEMVTSYYASSMGGTTVSAKDAWGGDVPYLQAKATPWENYMAHENAFWMVEMTPSALADRLRQAGYSVRGDVTSVKIGALAKNSTYIKQLDITDSTGQIIRITGTDAVRTALTPNVKSSNFVVGKGSVEYTETVITIESAARPGETTGTTSQTGGTIEFTYGDRDEGSLPDNTVDVVSPTEASSVGDNSRSLSPGNIPYSVFFPDSYTQQYDKDYGYTNLEEYQVVTAAGTFSSELDSSVTLMTGDGPRVYERQEIFVVSSESADAFSDGSLNIVKPSTPVIPEPENTHVTETLDKSTETTLYKVAYATSPGNFIFVGKGWGHGVGMSQYGAYDLANLGYDYIGILEAYFEDIELVHYRSVK